MSRITAIRRDPKLWEHAKKLALARMGGRHSARAMQLAVLIYCKMGGRYVGPKTGREGLAVWTQEQWRTRPGTDPIATHLDGVTSRYLPSRVWEKLTPSEARDTDLLKLASGTRQHWVPNTRPVARARSSRRNTRSQ